MRTIKFRVWDSVEKRMRDANSADGVETYPTLIAVGLHGLPICIDKESFKEKEIVGWNRDHNLVLMQFTGLLDKNGVEIYESDLISFIFGAGEIVWGVGCWKVRMLKTGKTHLLNDLIAKQCEKVGNIYENPELLEPLTPTAKEGTQT